MAEKNSFLQKHRRKLIQIFSLLIYNADVKHFFTGGISFSQAKKTCVPGLNCYSCPGAIASCPLGAIQTSLANGRFPVFVTGLLLLFGTLFGRMVCAFLCPIGLLQEFLYKIKSPKIKKTKTVLAVTRKLSLIKYFLLIFLCLALPLIFFFKDGIGSPFFCSWFCPAGTAEAGIPLALLDENLRELLGPHFWWKVSVALSLIVFSVFFFRPFCTFFCPLGAIYSFFNKVAVFGIKVDQAKCTHCKACTASCKMQTLEINDRECIRCGECASVCKEGAIRTDVDFSTTLRSGRNDIRVNVGSQRSK